MNKYEKLIEYVINEEADKAEELFHEIVVSKSRDIYESLMDNEDGMGGDATDELMNDISADEEGMREDDMEPGMGDLEQDNDFDDSGDMDDHEVDHVDGDMGDEDLEDRVVDLEDQLDALMSEFDTMMGGDEMEPGMDDMGMEPGMDDMGGEEEMGMEPEMEGMFNEAVALTKVTKGIAGTVEGESVGSGTEATSVNTKTINNDNSGAKGAMAKPHQKTGEDNGRANPTAQDMGSTTEPNESRVTEPKKKGEDAGVNKTSITGSRK